MCARQQSTDLRARRRNLRLLGVDVAERGDAAQRDQLDKNRPHALLLKQLGIGRESAQARFLANAAQIDATDDEHHHGRRLHIALVHVPP